MTMTTGLDYTVTDLNCYDSDCLYHLNTPDSFWYFHNAAYTLTQSIVEGATETSFGTYFNERLKFGLACKGLGSTLVTTGYISAMQEGWLVLVS